MLPAGSTSRLSGHGGRAGSDARDPSTNGANGKDGASAPDEIQNNVVPNNDLSLVEACRHDFPGRGRRAIEQDMAGDQCLQ